MSTLKSDDRAAVFDGLVEHFAEKIYASQKGRVRLQLVQEALAEFLGNYEVAQQRCREPKQQIILDCGGGLGQMTYWLAQRGYQVIYCDSSAEMLQRARQALEQQDNVLCERVRFVHCELKELQQHLPEQVDGIVFHAVLEWLPEPEKGLKHLLAYLRAGGFISLLFYNLDALIFKNLIRGNFQKVESNHFAGEPGSLTPLSPLLPTDVQQWLEQAGVTLKQHRGIRCFYDYMPRQMERSDADVLRLERRFSQREPYRSLARYQLFNGVKIKP